MDKTEKEMFNDMLNQMKVIEKDPEYVKCTERLKNLQEKKDTIIDDLFHKRIGGYETTSLLSVHKVINEEITNTKNEIEKIENNYKKLIQCDMIKKYASNE